MGFWQPIIALKAVCVIKKNYLELLGRKKGYFVLRLSALASKTETTKCRSSHPEVFLVKGVLEISSKFTGEHPCRNVEITLRHGYSPVNLLHIFRTHFTKNTSGRLLLKTEKWKLHITLEVLNEVLVEFREIK